MREHKSISQLICTNSVITEGIIPIDNTREFVAIPIHNTRAFVTLQTLVVEQLMQSINGITTYKSFSCNFFSP